jgi:hypothetical protein
MNISILNINGIGSAAAKALAGHQLNTVEQLAATTVEQLCLVPGFGPVRAESAIAEARAILTRSTLDIPDTTPAPETGKIALPIGSGTEATSKTKKDKKMAMTAKDKAKLKAKLKAKKAKIEKAKIAKAKAKAELAKAKADKKRKDKKKKSDNKKGGSKKKSTKKSAEKKSKKSSKKMSSKGGKKKSGKKK